MDIRLVEVVLNTTRTAADKTVVKMVVLAEAADRTQEQVVAVVIPAAVAAVGLILEMAEVAVPTILDLTRVVMQETTLITARS